MSSPNLASPSLKGLAYPLRIEGGNLAVSSDYDIKSQEIRSVIETRFFERVMRADYGVTDFTLDIIDPGLINSEFQAAISKEVQGLTSLSVTGDWISSGEDGIYKVYITYSVGGTQQNSLQFTLAR